MADGCGGEGRLTPGDPVKGRRLGNWLRRCCLQAKGTCMRASRLRRLVMIGSSWEHQVDRAVSLPFDWIDISAVVSHLKRIVTGKILYYFQCSKVAIIMSKPTVELDHHVVPIAASILTLARPNLLESSFLVETNKPFSAKQCDTLCDS